MLHLDSRNFHGWGYRRAVVAALENLATDVDNGNDNDASNEKRATPPQSMAKDELDYTSKMVGANLSNFSAWHNRTQLILRILNENSATDAERKKMLDDGKTSRNKVYFYFSSFMRLSGEMLIFPCICRIGTNPSCID